MGKSSPAATPPRDLSAEIAAILNQGPALLRSEQTLSPDQVGLGLRNLNLALYGTPAGTREVTTQVPTTAWRNLRTGEVSTTRPPGYGDENYGNNKIPPGQPGYFNSAEWIMYDQLIPQTTRIPTEASPGLISQYGDVLRDLTPIQNESTTNARRATYNDIRNLNPSQAAGYDQLLAGDMAAYSAGNRLTPEDQYNIVNPVRADWARRGLGASAPAQLDESLQLFAGGNALQQQRRSNLSNTLNQGAQLYTMPSLSFGQSPNAGSFLGMAGGYGNQPNILESLGGYGSDLFNTNFNAQSANNINQANADNANRQAAISAAIAAATIAASACYAAREIFGVTDGRWLQFREWVLYVSPSRFREFYLKHGKDWAARLRKASPGTRTAVQRWMLKKIQEAAYAV